MSRLDRFRTAQASPVDGFETALGELRSGLKRSHWIWYIFPQLSGLGMSGMARAYGIDGEDEAIEYLKDEELRARLTEITKAGADQVRAGTPLRTLMGSEIDAIKTVSSLTLFETVARRLEERERTGRFNAFIQAAEDVLQAAEREGYPRCRFTLDRLSPPERPRDDG